jgi:2-polyprenyl-3-methyl-5-hydroxy-6-metoxy-1,4-benzoquinol methylase
MPHSASSSGAHRRQAENGVLIGNQVDKSQLGNPLARKLVAGFDAALFALIDAGPTAPATVHEVGCGEGRLSRHLRDRLGVPVRASDFSRELVAENQARAEPGIEYLVRSIYDLDPVADQADLVVCCEVLEHVERPEEALAALRRLDARAYILSVPREPLWRLLNLVRGKYPGALGNTPGHLNHWSRAGFLKFLASGGFEVERCLQPLPWTMARGRFA